MRCVVVRSDDAPGSKLAVVVMCWAPPSDAIVT
jgi:hypothetical protein